MQEYNLKEYDRLMLEAKHYADQKDFKEEIKALKAAYDLNPTPRIASIIGNKYIIINNIYLAEQMFNIEVASEKPIHQVNGRLDLIRCALLDGDQEKLKQEILDLHPTWLQAHKKLSTLFRAAYQQGRLPWLGDLIASYLLSIRQPGFDPRIEQCFLDFKKLDQISSLVEALVPFEGEPAVDVVAAWLHMQCGARGKALRLLLRLGASDPDWVECEPAASLKDLLPLPLTQLGDKLSLKDRLAMMAEIQASHFTAIVSLHADPDEILSLITGVRSADVIPRQEVLRLPARMMALTKVVESIGPRSGVEIIDPLMNYGEQNNDLAKKLSDVADAIGESFVDGVLSISDEPTRRFIADRREPVALQVGSVCFRLLRQQASFQAYFAEKQSKNVIIYANSTAMIQEYMDLFARVEPQPRIWVVNAFPIQKRWTMAVTQLSEHKEGAPAIEKREEGSAAQGEPEEAEDLIQRLENVWAVAAQGAEAWAVEVAAEFAATEKPPVLVLSSADRVYGPTVRMIKKQIEDQCALFSLLTSPSEIEAMRDYAVESERLVEFSMAPRPDLFAIKIRLETVASWVAYEDRPEILSVMEEYSVSLNLVAQELHKMLAPTFSHSLGPQMALVHGLDRLFTLYPPAAFLNQPTRLPINRVAALVAQDHGIKVIEAMAVYMSRMPRYRRPIADLVLAIDTFSSELLVDYFEMPPHQVSIIGSLRFEAVLRRLAQTQENPFVDPASRLIMVVTQSTALNRNIKLVWQALNLLRKLPMPDLRMIIKMHPAEPEHHMTAYHEEIRRFRLQGRVMVLKDADSYLIAQASALVISSFSNLALEAASLDIPVLVLAEAEGALPVPFDEMGIAMIARPGAEFLAMCSALLNRTSQITRLARTRRRFFAANPLLTRPGSSEAAQKAISAIIKVWKRPAPPPAPAQIKSSRRSFSKPLSAKIAYEEGWWRIRRAKAPNVLAERPRRLILAEWTAGHQGFEDLKRLEEQRPSESRVVLTGSGLLRAKAIEIWPELASSFLPYASVDLKHDDAFFRELEQFVAPLRAEAERAGSDAMLLDGASDRLIDQLLSNYRFAKEACEAIAAHDADEIVLVCGVGYHLAAMLGTFLRLIKPHQSLLIPTKGVGLREREGLHRTVRGALRNSIVPLDPFPPERAGPAPLAPLQRRARLLITTATDGTYRDSVMEILETSTNPASWGLALLASDEASQAELEKAVDPERLPVGHKISAPLLGAARAAVSPATQDVFRRGAERMQIEAAKNPAKRLQTFWRYMASLARVWIPMNASRYGTIRRDLETMMDKGALGLVAASPGRAPEARIAFQLAHARGIPTLDIQTGTFSASRRYRRPIADLTTFIDKTHHDIYHDYFGMEEESLAAVGSPRIDRRLRRAREASLSEMRSALLRAHGAAASSKICLLATQPIEWEKSAAILDLVAQNLPPEVLLIVRPHPAEGEERHAQYLQRIGELNAACRIVLDMQANVYDLLTGSDFVATYFSTIALEAFALRRRVMIVNPFETPPALDFAAIGVGERMQSPADVAAFVARGLSGPDLDDWTQDPFLKILQDGDSGRRIDSIVEAMEKRNRSEEDEA